MKKGRVLILGAGNSRQQRIHALPPGTSPLGSTFEDNFEEVWTIDIDKRAQPKVVWDLEQIPWPVPRNYFDEVHAYEVLEHLGGFGFYHYFFALWEEIWDVLKPEGLVCATTPWWESIWVWQDPGHKICYSEAILTYLDQDQYVKGIGKTSMTDYRRVFPPPYSFKLRSSGRSLVPQREGPPIDNPKEAGFNFVLQKEVWRKDERAAGNSENSGGGNQLSATGSNWEAHSVLGGGHEGPGADGGGVRSDGGGA